MNYMYPVGVLLAFLVWLIFYFIQNKKNGCGKQMLFFSLLIAPHGPISQFWYLRDYWSLQTLNLPVYARLILDFTFAFSIAGLGAVSLNTLMGIKWNLNPNPKIIRIIGLYLFFLISVLLIVDFLKINSIVASYIMFLTSGFYFAVKGKIVWLTILNASYFSAVLFLSYSLFEIIFPGAIKTLNLLVNTNFYILFVPISEILWYFCAAFYLYGFFKYLFSD